MGTIFKYNNQLIQCRDLNKKLKKMRLKEHDIEIVKDNIPNEILEKEFVNITRGIKLGCDTDVKWTYHIYQNSKGYYLWGINSPDISYYGIDTSDYKLIDITTELGNEYRKWNPESKTGDKRYN